MQDMIKMVVVLTVLSALSGGLLAGVRNGTQQQIENQQLAFVKGPAIKSILEGASNDPIADRFKLPYGEGEESFFVGKFDGQPKAVVFETFGKGFGGDIGVMVGVNLEDGKIINIGVTTHQETPGIGSRAKTTTDLSEKFVGLDLSGEFKVKPDGGQIDALSGATVTSRGVTGAVTAAARLYAELKPQVIEKAKTIGQ
jgi:electron transport complex protein RnfG